MNGYDLQENLRKFAEKYDGYIITEKQMKRCMERIEGHCRNFNIEIKIPTLSDVDVIRRDSIDVEEPFSLDMLNQWIEENMK